MQTNLPDVYAVGDAAESFSLITKKPVWFPLGSTANKMGRIAEDSLMGALKHQGVLGTGIVRVFEMTAAFTGLSEKSAIKEGFEVSVIHNIRPSHADYLGEKELLIKAVADKKTGRLLGAQIIGESGVDKRIDVLATAISYGANVKDLFHLDLSYAPPFSTTKDPVHYVGMALGNDILHIRPLITPKELVAMKNDGTKMQIIDTRSEVEFIESHIEDAIHIPLSALRKRYAELDKSLLTVCYCNKGITGNAAQNILLNIGFEKVYNLSGGNKNFKEYIKIKK